MRLTHDLTLTHHGSADAADLMDALCDVYADAYGVEPGNEKTAAFRARATKALDRPRYGLLTARDSTQIVGFAFGYALPAGTSWWNGLAPTRPKASPTRMAPAPLHWPRSKYAATGKGKASAGH